MCSAAPLLWGMAAPRHTVWRRSGGVGGSLAVARPPRFSAGPLGTSARHTAIRSSAWCSLLGRFGPRVGRSQSVGPLPSSSTNVWPRSSTNTTAGSSFANDPGGNFHSTASVALSNTVTDRVGDRHLPDHRLHPNRTLTHHPADVKAPGVVDVDDLLPSGSDRGIALSCRHIGQPFALDAKLARPPAGAVADPAEDRRGSRACWLALAQIGDQRRARLHAEVDFDGVAAADPRLGGRCSRAD